MTQIETAKRANSIGNQITPCHVRAAGLDMRAMQRTLLVAEE